MLPFLTQPAVAPACYIAPTPLAASQVFDGAQTLTAAAPLGAGTFSCWVQRCSLGAGTVVTGLAFDASDALNGSSARWRDTGAFLHIVANADGVYVNGQRVAAGVAAFGQVIGSGLKALLCEVIFLAGDAHVPPTAFGMVNIHGVWVHKAASFDAATFGAKGFRLDFSDPLNPGKDISGRGNHFTGTGFDSAGKDTVPSTPTNVYPAFSPLVLRSTNGLARANTEAGAGGYESIVLTSISLPDTGRWEAEVEILSTYAIMPCIGIAPATADVSGNLSMGGSAGNGMGLNNHGNLLRDGVAVLSGLGAHTVGDRVRVVYDGAARKVWVCRLSSGWIGGGDPVAGTGGFDAPSGGKLMFAVSCDVAARVRLSTSFAPTTGCKPLCTANLPEPDIKDPAEGLAQASATGANIVQVLDATCAHWNTDGWLEIIKRLDGNESWRWRFADDLTKSVASDSSVSKGAAAALTASAAYVGLRLRIGKKYGVYSAEVLHTTGTATTVNHGLATLRSMVLAKRVDAAGDWLEWHPDLPAGSLLTFNIKTTATANADLTGFGANAFQIGAGMPSGTYRVVVLAERAGFIALGTYRGAASYPFAAADVAPLLFYQKRITGTGEHRVWLDATASGNPKPCLDLNDIGPLDSTYTADLDVGGARPNTAAVEIGAPGETYVHLQIGRPIGGVCVAPATAR